MSGEVLSVRYSPKPISEYRYTGHPTLGPSTSRMLADLATWNLAFLSHPYESGSMPEDPQFTVNARRTVQSRLDGSGPDITGSCAHLTLEPLLGLPAEQFVYRIARHPVLHTLPMFLAYGQRWVDTMLARSFRLHLEAPEPVPNLTLATEALRKFR